MILLYIDPPVFKHHNPENKNGETPLTKPLGSVIRDENWRALSPGDEKPN